MDNSEFKTLTVPSASTTTKGVRVALAIPSGDMLHTDFAMSLCAMTMMAKCSLAIMNAKSSYIANGRNSLVAQAQSVDATHMLFLDSDMVFPQDTIQRLLDHKKYIACATYAQRVPPFRVIGDTLDNKALSVDTGLIEMSRVPTGCLMIHMSVFDKLKKPYFRGGWDETLGETLSEDLEWCDRVRKSGFNIWCDVDLSKELLHLGQRAVSVADYNPEAQA